MLIFSPTIELRTGPKCQMHRSILHAASYYEVSIQTWHDVNCRITTTAKHWAELEMGRSKSFGIFSICWKKTSKERDTKKRNVVTKNENIFTILHAQNIWFKCLSDLAFTFQPDIKSPKYWTVRLNTGYVATLVTTDITIINCTIICILGFETVVSTVSSQFTVYVCRQFLN